MKTLTVTEAAALAKRLVDHAVEANNERADNGEALELYRICPKCGEITTANYCFCPKTVH